MRLNDIINEQLVKLTDIYDENDLYDESEAIYDFIDKDDFIRDFQVHSMTPKQAASITTSRDDTTVYQSYQDFATDESTNIVNDKIKHWDDSRIIVLMNSTLLDGNHHLIAGILANKSIKYIDLAEYT